MYNPDNWVVLKINNGILHYKVLAGWNGGYLTGDSWRMNSGITNVEEDEDYFVFTGYSGSLYRCHKNGYYLGSNNVHVYNKMKHLYSDKVILMDKETDWLEVDWNLK